jgi:hypothetical protein
MTGSHACFRIRSKGVTKGEGSFRERDASSFAFSASLFANDYAIFFKSRADSKLGALYLFNHLRRFGLMMHIGVDATLFKTG